MNNRREKKGEQQKVTKTKVNKKNTRETRLRHICSIDLMKVGKSNIAIFNFTKLV